MRQLFTFRVVLFIALASLWWTPNAQCQQYRFKNYPMPEGGRGAIQIVPDSTGVMWFLNGFTLSRFDGHSLKYYKHEPGDSLMNLGHEVLGVPFLDASGNLWLNNMIDDWRSRELLKYDRKRDGFVAVKPDVKGAKIYAITEEKGADLLWMGAQGEGLFAFNTKTGVTRGFVNLSADSATSFNSNFVASIVDQERTLLLGTLNGLWIFDKANESFSRPKCVGDDSIMLLVGTAGPINKFDKEGNQWITKGNHKTLLKINPAFQVVQRFDFTYEFPWTNYDMDPEGVFWFATSNGLVRWDSKSTAIQVIKHIPDDPYSLPSNDLACSTVDAEGNVWIASYNGVSRLLKDELRFFKTQVPGIDEIREADGKLVVSHDRKLWVGQLELKDNLSFRQFKGDALPNVIGSVYRSWMGKRYFWLGNFGGVAGVSIDLKSGALEASTSRSYLSEPGNPNSITDNRICPLWEDSHENVWVGTFNGLNIISRSVTYGEEGSVQRFVNNPKDTNSIMSNLIRAIVPEGGDSVWIATERGVDLYHHGQFDHVFRGLERVSSVFKSSDGILFVGTEEGLYEGVKKNGSYSFTKSSIIEEPIGEEPSMAEDKLGRLWVILAAKGILCYDRKQGTTVRFSQEDGFLTDPDELSRSSTGMMMNHNFESIVLFDPESLLISPARPSTILIGLEINNKLPIVSGHPATPSDFIIPYQIEMLNELVLDYRHNNFSLEFAAMEMAAPERNLYQHKLEGYDPNWIQTDNSNRRATYTNLGSGTYTFRVKASNHQGMWSDKERTLKVVILPPPWLTWWAYTGYGLFAVGLLLLARRSIVQRERLAANLKLERIELEKAKEVDRVKTSFFTNISHEFRTPLTLIKGPVQGMIEQFMNGQPEVDKEKIVGQLKLVRRNSDLLLKLINQLLDLAKLESGTLKVEKTEGEVNGFIRAVASSFESFARQKNITLAVEVPSGSHPALFDRDKLETILINLINNAIKFTPSGGTVKVAVTQEPTANPDSYRDQELSLVVSDTGIGIPPEHQAKIFERFHQVSEAHKEVGTGIGLSLVKELVTLMEGTITVKSIQGEGSEFTVVLPIEAATSYELRATSAKQELVVESLGNNGSARSSQLEARSPDGGDSRPQVLVVEDNADLRAFIIDSLGSEFQFHQAENGKQGLAIATGQVPDMIISDVMMPEMDGMEMTRRIKADIKTSHIPLILLTAKSGEDSKLEGLSKGADDYLTKPFNKQELLLKVRNGTVRMQKLRDKLKVEVLSSAPAVEVMSADEQFLNKVKETIIERMSDEQLSVESLADDIGMSRVQLYRKVSALTGMAVNELIRKLRLQRASQLLQQQWGPVSQVAYEVGFSNLSYFSKVFKDEFGSVPSDYIGKL